MDEPKEAIDDNVPVALSLVKIMDYIGSRKNCLSQGEQKLKQNHIVKCNVTGKSKEYDTGSCIEALVLQTSGLADEPHKVKLDLSDKDDFIIVCSCPAGSGGYCKHCIAVLLLVNREEKLPRVVETCTDIKQVWGKLKKSVQEMHKGVPIDKLCCIAAPKYEIVHFGESKQKLILESLLASTNYDSALQKHIEPSENFLRVMKRQREETDDEKILTESPVKTKNVPSDKKTTMTQFFSIMMDRVDFSYLNLNEKIESSLTELTNEEKLFYEKEVCLPIEKAVAIAIKTECQNDSVWKSERKKRFTGSICYEYYTYFPKDPSEKIRKALESKFKGNDNTQYGIVNEKHAINAYENNFNVKVKRIGFVINPSYPFLGCSPDGIIPDNLIEVKCPIIGEKLNLDAVIKETPYILKENGKLALKPKHKYYGQVQLNLAVLGLDNCHFIIYSKLENDCCIINVPRDQKFIDNLLIRLQITYFKYFIPSFL